MYSVVMCGGAWLGVVTCGVVWWRAMACYGVLCVRLVHGAALWRVVSGGGVCVHMLWCVVCGGVWWWWCVCVCVLRHVRKCPSRVACANRYECI